MREWFGATDKLRWLTRFLQLQLFLLHLYWSILGAHSIFGEDMAVVKVARSSRGAQGTETSKGWGIWHFNMDNIFINIRGRGLMLRGGGVKPEQELSPPSHPNFNHWAWPLQTTFRHALRRLTLCNSGIPRLSRSVRLTGLF